MAECRRERTREDRREWNSAGILGSARGRNRSAPGCLDPVGGGEARSCARPPPATEAASLRMGVMGGRATARAQVLRARFADRRERARTETGGAAGRAQPARPAL